MAMLMAAADVAAVDAAAAAEGAAGGALMATAGRLAALSLRARFGARRWLVLAGPGDNGGDGYVIAQTLHELGDAVALREMRERPATADAAAARTAWLAAGGRAAPLGAVEIPPGGVVVDALFGVGLARPLEGAAQAWAAALDDRTARRARVGAVDMPSGIAADTGRALGPAVAADLTVTFDAAKRGHRLAEGARAAGEVVVLDLMGAVGRARRAPDFAARIGAAADPSVVEIAPPRELLGRPIETHKYAGGAVWVAGGGLGASGAGRLAARAALRVGGGVVTLASPAAALPECAAQSTAVMLRAADDAEAFAKLLQAGRTAAVVIGPGHSVGVGGPAPMRAARTRTRAFVEAGLAPDRLSVLDADALTAFEAAPERLFERTRAAPAVLTPHAGEFARLFPDLAARLADPSQAARFGKIEAARAAAARAGAVVLTKGFDTVVAAPPAPDGAPGPAGVHAAVGPLAAPWLATAGAGDVLAGLIAGIAAQGWRPFEAACAAVWLHAAAARHVGPGLIAEDLTEAVPAALRTLAAGDRSAEGADVFPRISPGLC